MDTFCALRKKDVINICDGMRLGFVSDLEFDRRTGRICKLFVSNEPCYFGLFGKSGKIIVPWDCIVRIGDDIVLVNLEGNDSFLKGCC